MQLFKTKIKEAADAPLTLETLSDSERKSVERQVAEATRLELARISGERKAMELKKKKEKEKEEEACCLRRGTCCRSGW